MVDGLLSESHRIKAPKDAIYWYAKSVEIEGVLLKMQELA